MQLETLGGRGQAFRPRMGGNGSRRDGGLDRTEPCPGCPRTSARSTDGGISNVQAAAVQDASMNDDGEDSAVQQEVVDVEDSQGNGNWE